MPYLVAATNPLARVVCLALGGYNFVLFARIISTWIRPPAAGFGRVVFELLWDVTEPVLRPFRKVLPPVQAGGLGLDFSPILVFVILGVLQSVICF